MEPEENDVGRPTFNWEINFGHIMTIVTLIGAGFLAYLSIEIRISELDRRTIDYSTVRDQVKADGLAIQNLQAIISRATDTNQSISETLATIREDVAVIKATLADERQRTRLPDKP